MFPRVITLALTIVLLGCGQGPQRSGGVGFVNQTKHPDAELAAIWAAAQADVARSIDLNPVQRSQSNVPPDIVAGDPRALGIEPPGLLVAAVPDISARRLFDQTGVRRSDPTGMIGCPRPCDVRYSTAYSKYDPPVTKYAASWEFAGDNFSDILQYEFENQILNALGYDVSWR